MGKEHIISEEVFALAGQALLKNENWMAYNHTLYHLPPDDVHFFKTRDDAIEFAEMNLSDRDSYSLLHFHSLQEVLDKVLFIYQQQQTGLINELVNNKKVSVMNEKNLDYLKDNIKYLGFGDKLNSTLERNMKEGKPEFTLPMGYAVHASTLHTDLHFKKSESADMYFLNSYDARLQRPGKEDVSQSFRLDNGIGISAKEAYNLLEGRSVLREMTNQKDEKYHAWIKLDFENKDDKGNFKMMRFNDNYGYNLTGAVMNLPLIGLNEEQEKQLFKSLQKGNIHEVKMIDGKEETKMFIAANPQYKTMDIYDNEMKPLSREQKEKLQYEPDAAVHQMKGRSENAGTVKQPGEELSNKKENKSEEKKQAPDGSKKKQWHEEKHDNKKGQFKKHAKTDNVESLLPKKRVGQHGKGMSM